MIKQRFERRALSVTFFALLTTTANIGGDVLPALAVTGGGTAALGDAPWLVSIIRTGHICGGVILDPNTVLTAAHCVRGLSAASITVRANSLRHATGGTTMKVSKILLHSAYNPSVNESADLAILKTSSPIPLGETSVASIRLPKSYEYVAGTPARVAGWGASVPGGNLSMVLNRATTNLVKKDVCEASSVNGHAITAEMVCSTARPASPCKGDDGGPLVGTDSSGDILIGITISRSCADPAKPSVYLRIVPYLDWIADARS